MSSNPLEGDTVLVTGGAGFIGSHLVDSLVENTDVRVLDDFSTGDRNRIPSNVELIEGDLRDPAVLETAMHDVDVVFHQAGVVSVEESVNNPTRSHAVNAHGTLALLEQAQRDGVRVILASSAAIYGEPESVPISEQHPKAPTSPYGLEKLTADHYARLYHDLYDLPTVVLRYFNVYGPRQTAGDYSGVISVFLDQAREDKAITVHGDGAQTRDFVHVEDVVQANLLAATTDHVGTAYNIGTGNSISIRRLAETIQHFSETDAPIIHTAARSGDIDHSQADISRACSQLGYEPTVEIERGLDRLISQLVVRSQA